MKKFTEQEIMNWIGWKGMFENEPVDIIKKLLNKEYSLKELASDIARYNYEPDPYEDCT